MVLASQPNDIPSWLNNKLGASSDSWTCGSIVSQFNPTLLANINHCFTDLGAPVKTKLLLSLLKINHRNLQEWKNELKQIIEIAKDDHDPWVSMLAQIIKTYPETGYLNTELAQTEPCAKIFKDMVVDLTTALNNCSADKENLVLPKSCNYMNKNAFLSVVGSQPQSVKHFTLKKTTKASNLRAELLSKSEDALKRKSIGASYGSFPTRKATMPRKMGESADSSMKAKQFGTSGFNRNPKLPQLNKADPKKSSGLKLLDITEQPLVRAAMKYKKKQDIEDAKRLAFEAKSAKMAKIQENKERLRIERMDAKLQKAEEKVQGKRSQMANTERPKTPIYAADLASSNQINLTKVYTMNPQGNDLNMNASGAKTSLLLPSYLPPMPSSLNNSLPSPASVPYAPPPSATSLLANANIRPLFSPGNPTGLKLIALPPQQGVIRPLNQSSSPILQPIRPIPSLPAFPTKPNTIPIGSMQSGLINTAIPPPNMYSIISSSTTGHATAATDNSQAGSSSKVSSLNVISGQDIRSSATPPTRATFLQVPYTPPRSNILTSESILSQAAINLAPEQPLRDQQALDLSSPARKGLSLTKEQVMEAQEMFRNANKVTRPEKALMLGFMAGSRENPCPQLGHVVTIKISEHQESVFQADGTYLPMVLERHFQMDYQSGKWNCLKKYRNV